MNNYYSDFNSVSHIFDTSYKLIKSTVNHPNKNTLHTDYNNVPRVTKRIIKLYTYKYTHTQTILITINVCRLRFRSFHFFFFKLFLNVSENLNSS